MADDNKRTELVCVKVTERMALDLLRTAVSEERSVSDFMYRHLRLHLYGNINRLDAAMQITSSDKVVHES
jgi:hypothetical protein